MMAQTYNEPQALKRSIEYLVDLDVWSACCIIIWTIANRFKRIL